MADRFKFRDVPPDFGGRFPDGSYSVGRGADPRGLKRNEPSITAASTSAEPKSRAQERRRKSMGEAAE